MSCDGLRFVGPSDGFGADALAGVLVARMLGDDLPTGTDGYALADFVTEGAHRPIGLDHALAVRLVACERRFAEGDAGAPGSGPWAIAPADPTSPASPRDRRGTRPRHRPAHRARRRPRQGTRGVQRRCQRRIPRSRPSVPRRLHGTDGVRGRACAGPDLTDRERPPTTATVHAANVAGLGPSAGWPSVRTSTPPGSAGRRA